MQEQTAHFIGGPKDGQRMRLRDNRDYFNVALVPPLQRVHEETVAVTMERFEYRRVSIYYGLYVFVPGSWLHERDLHTKVLTRLLAGYVGNP